MKKLALALTALTLAACASEPPPPPPMASAPPPPPMAGTIRNGYIVFFDFNSDRVTRSAMDVLSQASAAYKRGGMVNIQVTGFADRSGSDFYNQRLSERRAMNVAMVLTRLGVPRNAMTVSGRGENDNRVPTADGVREPQNRRVEITN